MALWFTLVRLLVFLSGGFLLAFAQTTPKYSSHSSVFHTVMVGITGSRPLTLPSFWQNLDCLISLFRAMYSLFRWVVLRAKLRIGTMYRTQVDINELMTISFEAYQQLPEFTC
jgi:hypothetical protein